MKAGKLFWGMLFIVLGALFLLSNLGLMNVDWSFVARLWPLILVFWGVAALVGGQSPRWYAIVFVIIICLILAAIVEAFNWFEREDYTFESPRYAEHFTEPYESGVDRASLVFEAGAGHFLIEGTTDQLIDASTITDFGKYSLERVSGMHSEQLWLRLKKARWNWNFGRSRNRADVRLNPNPTWDMKFKVGAASVDFDLSPYETEDIRLDGGAASIQLRLGERAAETKLRLKAGVSSISIEVPSSSGCEISVEAPLSSKHFSDFEKVSSGTYRTANFDTATHRIYIDVEAGISSLRVSRY